MRTFTLKRSKKIRLKNVSKSILALAIIFTLIMGLLVFSDLQKVCTRSSIVGTFLQNNLKHFERYEKYKKYAIRSPQLVVNDLIIQNSEMDRLQDQLKDLNKQNEMFREAICLKVFVLIAGLLILLSLVALVQTYL